MAVRRSLFALPLLCISLALAGCENMDPAYWIPDNKKKLPGDRREVFPEGIPGVVQGVPPELIRGNAVTQPEGETAAASQPEQPPVEEKPKPRPRKVVRPIQPPPENAQRQAQPRQQPAPSQVQPRQAQPAPSSGGAWPQPQAAQQPAQQAPAASAWPAPPSSGTFTR